MDQRPLDGIQVLDFSQAIAGPFAATLLANLGADVITIEPPGGASQRRISGGNIRPNVMRNKRSVEVDLKADGAETVMKPLVAQSDVLIHSFAPGTMERLGYGYDVVQKYNEDIVYCSITGFGEDGPYSGRMGFDSLAQAMSGLLWNTGDPDRKPSRVGGNTIDTGTGIMAAFAVMVGLWDRKRSGEGQKIETSLLDTAAMTVSNYYTRYSRIGEMPQRMGHSLDSVQPIGMFETEDKPIYISCVYPRHWEQLCSVLDREEWIDDSRFATNEARIDNWGYLHEELEAAFAAYSRRELLERLLDAGVPAVEVQTIGEAAEDEHLHNRGTLMPFEDVDGTKVIVAGHPLQFTNSTPADGPIPGVGEHTHEILMELGFDKGDVDDLIQDGVVSDGTTE